jgi:hypothetical protein
MAGRFGGAWERRPLGLHVGLQVGLQAGLQVGLATGLTEIALLARFCETSQANERNSQTWAKFTHEQSGFLPVFKIFEKGQESVCCICPIADCKTAVGEA